MKKLLCILFSFLFFICNAHTAQIVNVEYIHNLISQEWDITVPYNPALKNVKSIANMKYLLTAIDVANEILNGEKTTYYGNGEFATTRIADTIATNQAVNTLIKQNKIEYKFSATIDLSQYDDNSGFVVGMPVTEFGFNISAAGTFYIDWGDGTVETIKKDNTEYIEYTHDYGTTDGVYTVQIGGRATDYSDDRSVIDFTTTLSPHSYSSQALTDINGSLGAIFGTLSNGKQPRFINTFSYAHSLKKIPENLFDGIYGDLVDGMFVSTFEYCSLLTGPSARINGQYLYEIWPDATEAQVNNMYEYSTGLDDYACIPYAWGGGGGLGEECDSSSSTPSAPEDAVYDFYLTTTSDTSVFEMQISTAGEFYIDWGDGKTEWITKSDTTNMTYGHRYASKGAYNIRLGGQATAYSTGTTTAAIRFYGTSSIASIDGSLGAIFGTLPNGSQPRFYDTFYGAFNMKGSIPSDLFAGISGAPVSYMFANTFNGCSGLTGAIPDGLFAGISGAPATSMFNGTFYGCSGLTSIPENLFGNISGTAQFDMFSRTFHNCGLLTGPSARINGKYLYEIWPDATSGQVYDMYYGATRLDDYRCIPTVWGGFGEDCSVPENDYKFFLTTTSTNSFSFKISAAGEFTVDWGDGTVETITKTNTTDTTYSHTYSTAGAYTIGIGGQATAYNGSTTTAAISFYVNSSQTKIASIDGSLGAIFGTLADGSQPRFYYTFYSASNIKGSIPANLFTGISGAPIVNMFYFTFSECSNLTGTIPASLFAGISGKPAESMFNGTFRKCTNLTGIPIGLFAGITGKPAPKMFSGTFNLCSNLSGEIPKDIFAGISGAPAEYMFNYTFNGCSKLTGQIPENMFGNISGYAKNDMYRATFQDCSGLTSIPENLFGNISGPAQTYMFQYTFKNCKSLTGPSARINGQYLYEIWPTATTSEVSYMYQNATGLSDYSNIPTVWK